MQIKCEATREHEAQLRYKHPLCDTTVRQRGHYRYGVSRARGAT